MPLSECNKASALRFQQLIAQLSLNMQFFLLKHCTKISKFLYSNFCTVETYTVMKKKYCTVTGAKIYGNFH
jgi:hypothetical protein